MSARLVLAVMVVGLAFGCGPGDSLPDGGQGDAGTSADGGPPNGARDAGGPPLVDGGLADAGAGMGDAGVADAGPAPVVCTSGSSWTRGNSGSAEMNPGLACRACHLREEPRRAYFYMGTVYPSLYEEDLCNGAPPSGVVVEILDKNGGVALTLTPSMPSGNFRSSSTSNPVALPYTARVVYQGRTMVMSTPQMDGDCNACHTERGANGAPGRIVVP